ncbi:hypothetical protein FOA52_012819 [Chlamydomonas sp. UWO 241]|nr:hypothetical protein FOA52_012819 [Chlamydomonas sp. UWO 241]
MDTWLKVNIAIAGVVLLAITGMVLYIYYTHRGTVEGFEEAGGMYTARINVMKIFEAVLNRKPTPPEVEAFSQYDNEQDMLESIMQIASESDAAVAMPPQTTANSIATPPPPLQPLPPLPPQPPLPPLPQKKHSLDQIADMAAALLEAINAARLAST